MRTQELWLKWKREQLASWKSKAARAQANYQKCLAELEDPQRGYKKYSREARTKSKGDSATPEKLIDPPEKILVEPEIKYDEFNDPIN